MKTLQISKFSIFMISIVVFVIGVYTILVYSSPQNVTKDPQKILLYDTFTEKNPHYVKLNDMRPNSFGFFMYPSSYNFSDPANSYQRFLLIRLPAWQSGGDKGIASFRAFSAVDLSSHCTIRYWPQEGRERIEDSCSGNMYRVIDGYLYVIQGNPILLQNNMGLPKLDLSVDNDGNLYVNSPTWNEDHNGVIGIGRKISQDDINHTTLFISKQEAERKGHKFAYPQWLVTGQHAASTEGDWYKETVYYQGGSPSHNFILIAELCECDNNPDFIINKAGKYSEVWQSGDEIILATPNAVGINKKSNYIFDFFKDGYTIEFATDQSFNDGMMTVLYNFLNGTKLSNLQQISINNGVK